MMLSTSVSRAGGDLAARTTAVRSTGYGRLFPNLLPWIPGGATRDEKIDYLYEMSEEFYHPRPDGAPDHVSIPAGYTYFAQFLNHDLSFDARNLPLSPVEFVQRARTPAM